MKKKKTIEVKAVNSQRELLNLQNCADQQPDNPLDEWVHV